MAVVQDGTHSKDQSPSPRWLTKGIQFAIVTAFASQEKTVAQHPEHLDAPWGMLGTEIAREGFENSSNGLIIGPRQHSCLEASTQRRREPDSRDPPRQNTVRDQNVLLCPYRVGGRWANRFVVAILKQPLSGYSYTGFAGCPATE